MAEEDFEQSYQQSTPPWDIGRPQPAVVEAAQQGDFAGRVLDCGCGTGENALYLASQGYTVVGVDVSPTAIARAQAKAQERGLAASFHVVDAFALDQLGQTFDTLLDCGLMHNFSADDRQRYAESLSAITVPGGRVILLCFTEATAGQIGPPFRLSQADIRTAFQRGWQVEEIRPSYFETHLEPPRAAAWLALVRRVAD
jgi:cyclopropane fatty-acyl-phospholipid synthase-like methyltransferase